ncbi:MAG: FHA domain-containing protein, partial [Candidatus Aureabacteria bacterium]|nr:FHA domain-containing protein [Candidatus Auribacterota bacterium]
MDKIFLEFIKGPKQGTHVTLQNGYMIGRDNACEIYIDDNSISKRHAVFEIVEKQVVIKDVGSSNGTFVNGRKVEKAALSHNDEISIGRSIAKIMFEGVDKEAAASPERTAMEKKIFPEPSKEESQKGAEKKKKTLKVLMLTVVAFVVILLVFIVMKSMISSRESKKPVSLV